MERIKHITATAMSQSTTFIDRSQRRIMAKVMVFKL